MFLALDQLGTFSALSHVLLSLLRDCFLVFQVNLEAITAFHSLKMPIFNFLASQKSRCIYIIIGSVFSSLGEIFFFKSTDVIAIYNIDVINFSICLCVPRHWAQLMQ